MSKAFEAGMNIAIIDFDEGLGFNILLDPYEREEQIDFLTKTLIEYKKNKNINPVVANVMEYMKYIGHGKGYSAIEMFKHENLVGIEEHTPMNKDVTGIFIEEDVIKAYYEKDSTRLSSTKTKIEAPVYVDSKSTAKTALTMTTKTPGRFCQAMKNGLEVFKKMLNRDKENITIEL
jgi:hypothetical protein